MIEVIIEKVNMCGINLIDASVGDGIIDYNDKTMVGEPGALSYGVLGGGGISVSPVPVKCSTLIREAIEPIEQ